MILSVIFAGLVLMMSATTVTSQGMTVS